MRSDIEEQDQIAIVDWVRLQHPKLFGVLHHSPNGGARDARTGAKMKKLGTKPGFPDLMGYLPRGGWSGIAIEMKRPASPGKRKGSVTDNQKYWLDHLSSTNWYTCVCFGQDEARELINHYMTFE